MMKVKKKRNLLLHPQTLTHIEKPNSRTQSFLRRIERNLRPCVSNTMMCSPKDSTDLGRSPLLTVEIDTGDHPLITQRPYSLALKHVEWVQEEIEKLEQDGVITRSMSPWASPIVIVPKKTAPGEPPHRRMCVDYRMVNSLAPPVVKAHSKAKGVLTFVPLPKIDEIFAKSKGS